MSYNQNVYNIIIIMNPCFHNKYAINFNKQHIESIFIKNDRFAQIRIDNTLLHHLRFIIKQSHSYDFQSYRDYDRFMLKMRKLIKYNIIVSKTILFAHYRVLIANNLINRNVQIEQFMRIKGARSRSGVVSVTIFMSGSIMGSDNKELISKGGCPMDCHYCPFEKDEAGNPTQPRSYLSTEPGCARATEQKFSPIGQVIARLYQLESIGHISNNPNHSNKIELIISGGTFNFYPKEYIEWFTTCAYYACNIYYDAKANKTNFSKVRFMETLENEQTINETGPNRIIGLTVETRPDYIMRPNKHMPEEKDFSQIELFRRIGVTRIQIGIQTTKDNILKKINRGCTNRDNKRGIRLLKQNGFKTDIHIMLDLPGSTPDIDKDVIDQIVTDPDLQTDQWKLYPTEVTPYTKIKEWYDKGLYAPYSDDHTKGTSYKMLNVLIYGLTHVPPYIRINRVVRDIPHISIEGGLRCSNMRQLASNKMKKSGVLCHDIRNREVKHKTVDKKDMIQDIIEYTSSGGTEYFIQYCSTDKMTLYGFIRLRLNMDYIDTLPCLHGCALIRELHVYGQHTGVGIRDSRQTSVQHTGLGSRLLAKAEAIASEHNYTKIAVISGVGVRDYYRKKKYILGEQGYLYKELPVYTPYSYRVYTIVLCVVLALYLIYMDTYVTPNK